MKLTTILLFGTFDTLHPGHLNLFQQAKKLGDKLIVAIARDETVQKIKGRPAKHSEQERLRLVQACPLVDTAELGGIEDKYICIKKFKPDIIALGYDQDHYMVQELSKQLAEIYDKPPKIVRLKPYMPEKYKSSLIRN